MTEFSSRRYDNDEVTRIIRRALKLDDEDTISHAELIETASRIGLDRQAVETAIAQEQRESRLRRRRTGFHWHLGIYLMVNAALLLTDKLTPGSWWFHWSVLGWGIGLAFHGRAVYFPGRRRFDRRMQNRHCRPGFRMCE